MLKTHPKYTRIVSHEVDARLYRLWKPAVSPLAAYTVKTVDGIFKTLKWIAAEKINSATGSDSRLSSYDEKIFDYYKRLINVYFSVVNIYNENSDVVSTNAVKSIWDGLYSVVLSRVKLFEENTGNHGDFAAGTFDAVVNPVLLEKKEIISKCIRTFAESFDNCAQRFKNEKQKELVIFARKKVFSSVRENGEFSDGISIIKEINQQIEAVCYPRFYEFYVSTVKFALINLNDLNARSDTQYYHELLLEERDILSSIIGIQAAVLEKELAETTSPQGERIVLNKVLLLLKEAYQTLLTGINEINVLFKAAEYKKGSSETVETEPFNDFAYDLNEKTAPSVVFQPASFDEARQEFIKRLALFDASVEAEAETALSNVAKACLKSNLYNFNKSIFETKDVTDDITLFFKRIVEFYEANKESLNEESVGDPEHTAIINGVIESINIKVECLEESKQEFVLDMAKFMQDFLSNEYVKNENSAQSEEQECAAAAERKKCVGLFNGKLCEALINIYNDDKAGVASIKQLLGEFLSGDLIEECNGRLIRYCGKQTESLNKKILRYKKDNLLFEISTFEEIMNYSVLILRNSKIDSVISLVKLIDNVSSGIYDVLIRHNIELIKPKPHDLFNGKEHEVLTAEKNEAFKKGEIVKLMNCGYKQNDEIIMRANVIAAK